MRLELQNRTNRQATLRSDESSRPILCPEIARRTIIQLKNMTGELEYAVVRPRRRDENREAIWFFCCGSACSRRTQKEIQSRTSMSDKGSHSSADPT
jgi:hypothetical protein